VKPAPFGYAKARSLEEAIGWLGQQHDGPDGGIKLLAGGQSLIATLNMRLSEPRLLVDINGLHELSGIRLDNDHLVIGAMTRQVEIERSTDIARYAPLLAKALPHIAHPAIRNRGTIGGSIAFADPAAELPACMVALNAAFEIAGPSGKRTVRADDFFIDLFETALGPQDVLTAIRIPAALAHHRCGFDEFARRLGDYAIVGLAATARAADAGLKDVRLAYFGVGATPVRALGAEAALAAGDLDTAVATLANDIDPQDDVQENAAVKLHLAGVLLRRVAKQLTEARS
jgi:carbon-monoxide dehydrogenase medium subunit